MSTRRAIIFANGQLHLSTGAAIQPAPGDLLIAADGGARHCLALGLAPHLVIGDFDSLEPQQLQVLQAAGAELIRHPQHKDETDLELALSEALRRGAGQVLIYGALGARWDMTLANLFLMAHPAYRALDIRLIDGLQEICLLQPGQQHHFYGQPRDTLSLLPLCGPARGITTFGLEYPLNDGTLEFGSPRGVSNVFLEEHASLTLQEGLLVCILIHSPTHPSKESNCK
ncbi:MAG TPA: thiamine diphosphokinase [Anaerolineales bacterium]|nr:thiamine diphosphokinase [Anaerolineales bacterium]